MPTAFLAPQLPQACRGATLIWLAALAGLLLLPVNFRAGSPSTHGHSVYQLLADAADGALDHHQGAAAGAAAADDQTSGAVHDEGAAAPDNMEGLDAGDHNDSAPATPGTHLFIAPVLMFVIAPAGRSPAAWLLLHLHGRRPTVPRPPPRPARIGA